MKREALVQQELTEDSFPATWKILRAGIAEQVAPGFAVGLWDAREPRRFLAAAIGERRMRLSALPGLPALPMKVDTVFDLASVTKVFATAPLFAALVDRGWVDWDTPLAAILPDYPLPSIRMKHLLSHTSGLPAWAPFWEKLRDEFGPRKLFEVPVAQRQRRLRELVCAVQPEAPVGERVIYSDISFLLLGFALEELTRMPLDEAVRRFLWEPMGVQGACYRRVEHAVDQDRFENVAATELSEWRGGVLQGQVHDDNCWAMGGYAGHAGVFAAIQDLMFFSSRLFDGFFSRETLRRMWAPVEVPKGCSRTLGWDMPSGPEPAASARFSPDSVGHLGFTGTSLWIDPRAGLSVALLSNRVHPSRENTRIKAYRSRLHAAIREDLGR